MLPRVGPRSAAGRLLRRKYAVVFSMVIDVADVWGWVRVHTQPHTVSSSASNPGLRPRRAASCGLLWPSAVATTVMTTRRELVVRNRCRHLFAGNDLEGVATGGTGPADAAVATVTTVTGD